MANLIHGVLGTDISNVKGLNVVAEDMLEEFHRLFSTTMACHLPAVVLEHFPKKVSGIIQITNNRLKLTFSVQSCF